MLTLKIPGLNAPYLQRLSLTESCNTHSRLECLITVCEERVAILKCLGVDMELYFELAGQSTLLFKGIITAINEEDDRHWQLVIGSRSVLMDLTLCTRSFVANGQTPVAIKDLPGFRNVFQDIHGLDRLAFSVASMTQWRESDWIFLIRLAQRAHVVVVNDLHRGIWLLGEAPGPNFSLVEAGILAERISVSLGFPMTETVAVNLTRGTISGPIQANAKNDWPVAGIKLLSTEPFRFFVTDLPTNQSSRDISQFFSEHTLANLFRWDAECSNPTVGVGAKITFPNGHPVTKNLVVIARHLIMTQHHQDYGIRNKLICTTQLIPMLRG